MFLWLMGDGYQVIDVTTPSLPLLVYNLPSQNMAMDLEVEAHHLVWM